MYWNYKIINKIRYSNKSTNMFLCRKHNFAWIHFCETSIYLWISFYLFVNVFNIFGSLYIYLRLKINSSGNLWQFLPLPELYRPRISQKCKVLLSTCIRLVCSCCRVQNSVYSNCSRKITADSDEIRSPKWVGKCRLIIVLKLAVIHVA